MRYLLAIALLFAAAPALAQCPSGVCPLQLHAGQPVRNVVKAPLVVAGKAVKATAKVAKAAVVLPAKAVKRTACFFRERKPVRRVLRFTARVVTFRGPILSAVRARRCH